MHMDTRACDRCDRYRALTAARDDERVLHVPGDGEDEDDQELDHAHGEELVHLFVG